MNTSVTSKEAILETCRKLVSEQGFSVLNMRTVAKECGVALGSLYYYFPSKNDLMIATVESVWEELFCLRESVPENTAFPDYLARCFSHIRQSMKKYPNFFTVHSISVSTEGQPKARTVMNRYLAQIKEKLLRALQADERVSEDAFSSDFTEAEFIEFVLSAIVCLLVQKTERCDVLLTVIRRTIYRA